MHQVPDSATATKVKTKSLIEIQHLARAELKSGSAKQQMLLFISLEFEQNIFKPPNSDKNFPEELKSCFKEIPA